MKGATVAESTMPGKAPGGRVAREDYPECDLAWAVDDLYVIVIFGWDLQR